MGFKMKGQMIFEFIISAVLFFAIVFYVMNVVSANFASFGEDFYLETLRSKVTQVSEVVVKQHLSDEWPVVTDSNIAAFESSYCSSNYQELLDMLDLDEKPFAGSYNINITIKRGDDFVMDCGPGNQPSQSNAHIRRYVLSDDLEEMTIDFWLW